MDNTIGNNTSPGWSNNVTFSWYDYTLFSAMLVISALIGIYFGCFGKGQSTANEYLLGGNTMRVFPISMSLVASHISGITLLAVPADVYSFGATYWFSMISIVIVCTLTSYVYMPVFYKLQLTSIYEYLKLRFDTRTRLFASFVYTLSVFLYLPIVIYIPALAFAQGTGMNIYFVTPLVCGVCIFYTTIGGLKTVVWTDTIQFTITTGSIIAVLFVGVRAAGGVSNVFRVAEEGQRLNIDFDPDPTKRDTFWAVVIGWTINWVSHVSLNQGCVQKFMALPSLENAKKAILLFGIGIMVVKSTSVAIGLIMYQRYSGCDPFTIGHVKERDQLLPYYIMDVAGSIPGLPGLFIAGVFCTALSTLSATMNCLAGSFYEDFVSRHMPRGTSQKTVSNVLKLLVVVIGVTCTSLVFLVERLGGLLALSISFSSITSGTLLGLFSLGMFFPKVNSKGAFYGSAISLAFMCWLVGGAQWYKAKGLLKYIPLPASIDSCDSDGASLKNVTSNLVHKINDDVQDIFYPYRISHYYYSLIGATVCILAALPISWATNKHDPPVHEDLISPAAHFLLPKRVSIPDYSTIPGALHLIALNTEKERKL